MRDAARKINDESEDHISCNLLRYEQTLRLVCQEHPALEDSR